MDESATKTTIIKLLKTIPKWDEGAVLLTEWQNQAGIKEESIAECVETVCDFLSVFDVISIYETDNNKARRIKTNSETAYYFINSLANHFQENNKILSNWERTGIKQTGFNIQDFLSGPQFLYAIEHQRKAANNDTRALRNSRVVKAIIKARVQGHREPVYLTQFDEVTKNYQLIGGHIRKTDNNFESAMRREISEELSEINFSDIFDYKLSSLGMVEKNELSLTFGIVTEYQIFYFQPHFNMKQITLSPNDRWVTLKELLNGKTKDGKDINESATFILNEKLPGGLKGLGLSLEQLQKRSLVQIIKEHPWEAAGIILSILGILISILFYFLGQ